MQLLYPVFAIIIALLVLVVLFRVLKAFIGIFVVVAAVLIVIHYMPTIVKYIGYYTSPAKINSAVKYFNITKQVQSLKQAVGGLNEPVPSK